MSSYPSFGAQFPSGIFLTVYLELIIKIVLVKVSRTPLFYYFSVLFIVEGRREQEGKEIMSYIQVGELTFVYNNA